MIVAVRCIFPIGEAGHLHKSCNEMEENVL